MLGLRHVKLLHFIGRIQPLLHKYSSYIHREFRVFVSREQFREVSWSWLVLCLKSFLGRKVNLFVSAVSGKLHRDMETNTTITYMPPPPPHMIVQPHVVTPVPVQTQVVTVRERTYGAEKSVGLGVTEIILRVICLVSCNLLFCSVLMLGGASLV